MYVTLKKKCLFSQYHHLSELAEFPREEILSVMLQFHGDRQAAEDRLQASKLQPFVMRIWAQQNSDDRMQLQVNANLDMYRSFSTSIINHTDFQDRMRDQTMDPEVR